ncbi:MAG: CAP domain-containing protein [Gaiellaceae bacterium]
MCTLALAGAMAPAAAAGTERVTLSASERALVSVVNDVRGDHGLRPLRVDRALTRAARAYSATLLRTGVFTHGAMGARLAEHGARGPMFGENLAWGTGSRASARSVVRAWLSSPGHRANLLRPGWKRIGIGALKGSFQGHRGATVVTADFAGR